MRQEGDLLSGFTDRKEFPMPSAYALGSHLFSLLDSFKVRGYYTKVIPELIEQIRLAGRRMSEVISGGITTVGASVTASVLQANVSAAGLKLNGKLKALGAITNGSLMAAPSGSVGRSIYQDGSSASGITLGTSKKAYVTLIACNTDGAGGVVDTDDGAVKVVAVIKGTSATAQAATAHLTSIEIQRALEASSQHAGVTGWVHLAQILWDENAGSPQATIVLNRNNVREA